MCVHLCKDLHTHVYIIYCVWIFGICFNICFSLQNICCDHSPDFMNITTFLKTFLCFGLGVQGKLTPPCPVAAALWSFVSTGVSPQICLVELSWNHLPFSLSPGLVFEACCLSVSAKETVHILDLGVMIKQMSAERIGMSTRVTILFLITFFKKKSYYMSLLI